MRDKYIKFLAYIVAAIVIGGAVLFYKPFSGSGKETVFVIEKGQSLGSTAKLLAEKDLIYSHRLFVFFAILTGREKNFKSGTYTIPPGSSMSRLINAFSRGLSDSEDLVVVVPEGSNINDLDKIFTKSGLIKEEDLLNRDIMELEGYLFPDTYRFRKDDSIKDIIQKMRKNFDDKTKGLFDGMSRQQKSEVLIIASMLEKEVRTAEDMRLVAGIMQRRLSIGMPLQIDATLTYGLCVEKFRAKKRCEVSQENIVDNLGHDSLYNTYKIVGLPEGPISNPGLAAIEAAIDPESSDYLFYLNARDDGRTIYSKTAAEHEKARRQYLGL